MAAVRARATESKNAEVKSEEKIDSIKKLIEAAKLVKPLDPAQVTSLSQEDSLRECKSLFANDDPIKTGEEYFRRYVELYGKTEPSFSTVRSLFGGKTNQVANATALLAIGNRNTIRRDLLPQYIFDVICKLKEIPVKSGETAEVIKSIISIYRMPLEDDKFNLIKNHFSKPLEVLEIYNATGIIPSQLRKP